jgi:hypothetical protein
MYLMAVFAIRSLLDWIVGWFGGPKRGSMIAGTMLLVVVAGVPSDVLVPAAVAEEARNKSGALFQEMPLKEVFA